MTPSAHIAHTLAGRLRIRIPARRRDSGYFASLADAFGAMPGIEGLEVNALTASLLLYHTISSEQISEFAERRALFRVVPERNESASLSTRLSSGLEAIDSKIRGVSDGSLDFWGAVFLVLVAMSIVQLAQGHILAPASTLLWYALGTFAVPSLAS
ncbi:MAG: HMA2 domain-containing protein [Gammaproteobacteria bacterium]